MSRPVKSLKLKGAGSDSFEKRALREVKLRIKTNSSLSRPDYSNNVHYTELIEMHQRLGTILMMCMRNLASTEQSLSGPQTKPVSVHFSDADKNNGVNSRTLQEDAEPSRLSSSVTKFLRDREEGNISATDIDASFPLNIPEGTVGLLTRITAEIADALVGPTINKTYVLRRSISLVTTLLEQSILNKT
jgi:hypothetical protein